MATPPEAAHHLLSPRPDPSPAPPPPAKSIPMLFPVVILFFILLCFLSIFLFRDILHYSSLWLSRARSSASLAAGGRPTGPGAGEGSVGLDPAILASFPKLPYSAVRGVQEGKCGGECAVCLSEFAAGDVLRLLTVCCHAFHPGCIDSWLASHTTCPVCRSDLEAPPDEAAVTAVREAVVAGEVRGGTLAVARGDEEGRTTSRRTPKSRSTSLEIVVDRSEEGRGEGAG